MSKGDTYRPVDKKKFDKNWERIFKKSRKKKRTDKIEYQREEER